MSDSKQSSYRSIFKATTLFGGVQIYQIVVQIIKSKFIAVLLGPEGVGIQGLYHATMDLYKNLTSFGLSQSAVRDVSEANGTKDMERINRTVTVVRRLVWITGMLGLLAVAILSPFLSKTTFGNYDYTIPFILLSITLLIDQISAGQKVVLQGMRRLKDLAKASAIGATFGLIVSIPLYYWMGIEGIVPTLILNSITALIISWVYSRKIKIDRVQISTKDTLRQGREMLSMGIAMSLSAILVTATSYIVRGYVRSVGGTVEVGLYQAGYAIITTYVGMVFKAISTDYYPRLAAVNKDNEKCREVISQQGELATYILAPMLSLCILFMPLVLQILYSDKFLEANDFIVWCCLGMMLRLASWLISFVFLAKAESKLFMYNEIAANITMLLLNIVCYKLWGLSGLGIAFTLSYLIYFIQVYIIARIRYGFRYTSAFSRSYIFLFIAVLSCFAIVMTTEGFAKYGISSIVLMITIAYSLIGLNNKLDLKALLNSKIRNNGSK